MAPWFGTDVFVDGHVSIVKPNPAVLPSTVLAYVLLSCQAEIEGLAEGSTGQTELSPRRLAGFRVVVPTAEGSKSLEQELLDLEMTGEHALRESVTLRALRDALLPELLSGRLRVREAEKGIEGVM